MKPLGDRTKAFAYRFIVDGPLRPLAKPVWRSLLAIEEAWFRNTIGQPLSAPLDDVTAVIKTFERPARCRALIRSLRALHPSLRIIVADDSLEPTDFGDVAVVRLPFDSGVGAGRQAALDKVVTPFVLNLDDDFLFYRQSGLAAALALLKGQPRIDILGGQVIDLPLFIIHDFRSARLPLGGAAALVEPGTRLGGAEVMDKVPNFFLARTNALRQVGWDPALKRLDHADFFARARGTLVSAQSEDFRVLHRRDPFNSVYLRFRHSTDADSALLRSRYFST